MTDNRKGGVRKRRERVVVVFQGVLYPHELWVGPACGGKVNSKGKGGKGEGL